jgi:predicted nucleic acid-binding protein
MSAEQLTIRYAALTTIVQPSPIAPTAADPDDDMVLATAMAANASFIVSGDKQLMKVCVLSGIELLSAADAGVRLSHQT